MYKIITRRKPELHNGKVKRTGKAYFIVQYWAGFYWLEKEFSTRQAAKEFTAKLAA